MRTLSVVVAAALTAAALGGCGSHQRSAGPAGGAGADGSAAASSGPPPPSVAQSSGAQSSGAQSSGGVTSPAVPGPGGAPGGTARPGATGSGVTPCLTSQRHFDTEADGVTPRVCLRIGGAFDVTSVRPERSLVTAVVSRDPAVVSCGTPRPTVCVARSAGQSVVTATDGGGEWTVAVYVAR